MQTSEWIVNCLNDTPSHLVAISESRETNWKESEYAAQPMGYAQGGVSLMWMGCEAAQNSGCVEERCRSVIKSVSVTTGDMARFRANTLAERLIYREPDYSNRCRNLSCYGV